MSSGTLTNMKDHLLSSLHFTASASRSKLSPIGIPHPLRNTSCMLTPQGFGLGQASYATVSDATAANALSQCQRTASPLASTPQLERTARCGSAAFSSVDSARYAGIQPARTSRTSPRRNSVPWEAATALSSERGMAWAEKWSIWMPRSVAQENQSRRTPRPVMVFLAMSV